MKLHAVAGALLLRGAACLEQLRNARQIEEHIRCEGLVANLERLAKIAQENGGNRAFGLPGYDASVEYIVDEAVKLGDAITVEVQPFMHLFETTRRISLTGPTNKSETVITLMYNAATPLPGGAQGELIHTPVDDERGSGCFADQWEGIDATDKISLIKRGGCAIADKLILARQHGALAAVLYNAAPGANLSSATLGAANIDKIVPVGLTTLENGEAWARSIAAGEAPRVTLVVDSVAEQRQTWNVIAETEAGDAAKVVVLGAHLDSVQAGMGINDDGSGSMALLEIMRAVAKYREGIVNKLRFAWWGAEESGLVGSRYYTANLDDDAAASIAFYFNYDMIGSMNPRYAVYANNDADKAGARPLLEHLLEADKPAEYAKFGNSSDYVGFIERGIPSSGIFTGAGEPWDTCYHQACDDICNINWEALEANARAAAYVAARFAMGQEPLPPRNGTTPNRRRARDVFAEMSDAVRVAEKTRSCSQGDNME